MRSHDADSDAVLALPAKRRRFAKRSFDCEFAATVAIGLRQRRCVSPLQKLIDMGFPEGDARRALADCSGVVGDAAERLIRSSAAVAGASSSGGVGGGEAPPAEAEGEELAEGKGEGEGEGEDVDEEGHFTLLASSRRMPPVYGAEVVGRRAWVDAARMQQSRGPHVHAML